MNKNKSTKHQNLYDIAKAVFREKFNVVNIYIYYTIVKINELQLPKHR